jgi:hypothetical protein
VKHHMDFVTSPRTGLGVGNATVTVFLAGTATLATLYSANSLMSATLPNPVTTASNGSFDFYVPDGVYDLEAQHSSFTSRWETDVEIFDLAAIISTAGSGAIVATRGQLAALPMTNNAEVRLTESGRAGNFKFDNSNLSAKVTADPYQGIYVAPAAAPSGASGAWVRVVTGQKYQASWWGVSTAVANNTPLLASASSIALLPAGGELHLDAGSFPQTTSWGIIRDDFSIIGKGYKTTKLVMAVGSGAIGNLGINGSNVRIDGIGFYTNSIHAFANNNPNVGLGAPNGAAAPLYQNWRITNCWFEGGAIGLIASGSDDNNATLTRAKDVYVQGCVFVNDEMGVSIAACENVEVSDCRFEMIVSTQNGAGCCLRTWGSKNVKFTNCFGSANSEFGILVSTMARTTGTGVIRLQNENVFIDNCEFTNCLGEGVHVTECIGNLIIRDSTFEGNIASNADTSGIDFAGGFAAINGVVPICKRVKVEGCTFIGYRRGFDESMAIRQLSFDGCIFVGNSDVTAYPGGTLCGRMAGGIELLEIFNCKFLMHSQAPRFRVTTGNVATRVVLVGNMLPEGAGGNVHDVAVAPIIVLDQDNRDYPAGTFAQHIA